MRLLLSVCLVLCAASASHGQLMDLITKVASTAQEMIKGGPGMMQDIMKKVTEMTSALSQQARSGSLNLGDIMKKGEEMMKDLNTEEFCKKMMEVFKEGSSAAGEMVSEQFKQGKEMMQKFMSMSMSKEDIMKMMQENAAGLQAGIQKAMALGSKVSEAVSSGSMNFATVLSKAEEMVKGMSFDQFTKQMMDIMQKGSEVAVQAYSQPFQQGKQALENMVKSNMPKEEILAMLKEFE